MVVGYAMLFLSFGWSMGSLAMGRAVNRLGRKPIALAGGLLMAAGAFCCLGFTNSSPLLWCFAVFMVIGLGMGSITLSTLLIVQDSLGPEHLGAATSFHQFARTLGGTVGVGLCGSLVFTRLTRAGGQTLPPSFSEGIQGSLARIFQPEFQASVSPGMSLKMLHAAVLEGVGVAFLCVAFMSCISLVLAFFSAAGKK